MLKGLADHDFISVQITAKFIKGCNYLIYTHPYRIVFTIQSQVTYLWKTSLLMVLPLLKKFKKQLLASIIYTLHLHVKDLLKIMVEDDDKETAIMSINQNSSKWRYLK